MSLLIPGEIGIYTLPTSVEFSENPLRGDSGKYRINRDLARAAVNQSIYAFFIENYQIILGGLGIDRSTDYDVNSQKMINQAVNYFYKTKNANICSPLSVGYLARNLQDSENFAIYIGRIDREQGQVINKNGKKILQKAIKQFIPKNMISFRFVGSHIHVIAFCTNKKYKGGGGRLITILKETCKGSNIPCISLYALKSAESYYLLQGFVFLTDNDGNVVTGGRHKAMVWYNPSFNLNNYLERDGLHTLSELNVPSEDYNLNRAVNDKLKTEEIVAEWVYLANRRISFEESHQNQEIVNEIEASPEEILNSPAVLSYIQDTQPEQYEIMTPQISETKKRGRSSSDDEEPITIRPSRRRIIVESDDEGEYGGGGSRRRKRVKKTKNAKRKYKNNKRTYKR
jgi:hypothetical protein